MWNQKEDGYLLESSFLETEGSIVDSVKRGGGRINELQKARSSFWARWAKHHGDNAVIDELNRRAVF